MLVPINPPAVTTNTRERSIGINMNARRAIINEPKNAASSPRIETAPSVPGFAFLNVVIILGSPL